jgi:uncharacterized protein (DUF488 family)
MILTLGHSRRPIAEFLAILSRHRIAVVADVRRKPYSRREPQFNRESLAAALAGAGIGYVHFESLGGLRELRKDSPHVALPAALRGFADYMETPEFRAALEALIARSAEKPTAICCAEASPARCHRRLISDALLARGVPVEHLIDLDQREPHRLSPGLELRGDRLHYAGRQSPLDLGGA